MKRRSDNSSSSSSSSSSSTYSDDSAHEELVTLRKSSNSAVDLRNLFDNEDVLMHELENKDRTTDGAKLEGDCASIAEYDPYDYCPVDSSPKTKNRHEKRLRFRVWEKDHNRFEFDGLNKTRDMLDRTKKWLFTEKGSTNSNSSSHDISINGAKDSEEFDQPSASTNEPISSIFSNKQDISSFSSPVDVPESQNAVNNALNAEYLDPTQTLIRGLNELTLNTKKGFSLRLKDNVELNSSKDLSSDASFDNVDILDQNPPNLPYISEEYLPASSKTKSPRDLSIGLFDAQEVNAEIEPTLDRLQKVFARFSFLMDSDIDKETITSDQLVDKIEYILSNCSNKLDEYKVQQIKLQKQFSDSKIKLAEYQDFEELKRTEFNSLQETINLLLKKCTNFEIELESTCLQLSSQKEANLILESSLGKNLELVSSLKALIEVKDSSLEDIALLVSSQIGDKNRLKLSDKVKFLVESLQNSNDTISRLNTQTEYEKGTIKTLNSKLQREVESKNELQEKYNAVNTKLLEEGKKLEELNLKTEDLVSTLKEKNDEIYEIRQTKGNLATKLSEAESQVIKLQKDNLNLEKRNFQLNCQVEKDNKTINEQLRKVEESNTQIEHLSNLLESSKDQLSKINDQKLKFESLHLSLISEVELITTNLKKNCEEQEYSNHQHEIIVKNCNNLIKRKEEEVRVWKNKIQILIETQSRNEEEISDLRLKLSDQTNENKIALKKIDLVNKKLQTSQLNNSNLRSELLQTSHINQEIGRVVIDLLINIVKEFDGVIDDVSLANAKAELGFESFMDAKDNKYIDKLDESCFFIKQGVSLVVSEYYSLTRRLSNFQKQSLESSSVAVLQKITHIQSLKISKLEKKIRQYRRVLKKINMVNERPTTSTTVRRLETRSSAYNPKENQGTDEDDSNTSSINSNDFIQLDRKQSQINKILAEVNGNQNF